MLKNIILLALLIISSTALAEGVVMQSMLLDRTSEEQSSHYICLGEGWEKSNQDVHKRISSLTKTYPKLFTHLGEGQFNCFSPQSAPKAALDQLEDILDLIDKGAGDKFQVILPEDGKAHFDFSTSARDCIDCSILRNQDKGLGTKLIQSQKINTLMKIGSMGFLMALPSSITQWEKGWMKDIPNNLKAAWTKSPVFDPDPWAVNYIVHPMAGAFYYNSLRSQGATRLESFLVSAFQSTIWEYGIEAIAERPSIQDLYITPIVGSVLGELAHQATLKMKQNGFTLGEKILVSIINPAYVLNNGFKVRRN